MKRASARKKFWDMTEDELAKATAEFDREHVRDTFEPLAGEEAARWRKARRKRGRPPTGKGAKVVSVSVEKGLLSRSDRLARRLGISRAALIARGLRRVLETSG